MTGRESTPLITVVTNLRKLIATRHAIFGNTHALEIVPARCIQLAKQYGVSVYGYFTRAGFTHELKVVA